MIRLDRHRRRLLPCARCGALGRVRDRLRQRAWKHVPLWGIPVKVLYRPARIKCPSSAPPAHTSRHFTTAWATLPSLNSCTDSCEEPFIVPLTVSSSDQLE